MTTFDPFTASLEEAQVQADADGTDGAVLRWGVAAQISANRNVYEAAPLDGVAKCVRAGLLVPEWLAVAFVRAYDQVLNCRAASWDAAFGPPFPKGTNLAAARHRRMARARIQPAIIAVLCKSPEARAIDKSFWEEVGRIVGAGASQTEKLYREQLSAGWIHSVPVLRKTYAGNAKPRARNIPTRKAKPVGLQK